MKVYDCFCFFNEVDLLNLRLAILNKYVDYFIICESKYTISGNPKSLYFDRGHYKEYSNKIRHLVIESYPFDLSDPWRNERFQRDYLFNGLYDARDDDLIIISDVDEIPNPLRISAYDKKYTRGDFSQYLYAYYLNNREENMGKPVLWNGSKITTFKTLKSFFGCSMELFRNFKFKGILRGLRTSIYKWIFFQNIKNGGWHFTSMMGVNKIIEKIESFAHQEFNTSKYKDPESIRLIIDSGRDIFNSTRQFSIQSMDKQFPEELIANLEKYEHLIKKT